jgi:hypothetical protein
VIRKRKMANGRAVRLIVLLLERADTNTIQTDNCWVVAKLACFGRRTFSFTGWHHQQPNERSESKPVCRQSGANCCSALLRVWILLRIRADSFYDPWVLDTGCRLKWFLAAFLDFEVPIVSEVKMIEEPAFARERKYLLERDVGISIKGILRVEGVCVNKFSIPPVTPGKELKKVISIEPDGILDGVMQV